MMRLASMNAGMAYDVFGWSYYYGFGYFCCARDESRSLSRLDISRMKGQTHQSLSFSFTKDRRIGVRREGTWVPEN